MLRLRLSRRDRQLVGWGAGGAVLAGALLGALSVLDRKPPPAPRGERAAPAAPAPPAAVRETSRGMSAPDPKVQERPLEPAEVVPLQPVELDPPYLIVDGLTFSAGFNTYRLDGLQGPAPAAACRNAEGHLWACGLQARAALNNAIQRRRLVCTPVRASRNGVADVTCTADGADVGKLLAAQGWARPAPSGAGSSAYANEAREAESDGRGLWNGGWTYSGPG